MLLSAMRGTLRSGPRPPSLRGWVAQAKWENLESVEMPIFHICKKAWKSDRQNERSPHKPKTLVLSSLKRGIASLKARISLNVLLQSSRSHHKTKKVHTLGRRMWNPFPERTTCQCKIWVNSKKPTLTRGRRGEQPYSSIIRQSPEVVKQRRDVPLPKIVLQININETSFSNSFRCESRSRTLNKSRHISCQWNPERSVEVFQCEKKRKWSDFFDRVRSYWFHALFGFIWGISWFPIWGSCPLLNKLTAKVNKLNDRIWNWVKGGERRLSFRVTVIFHFQT